MSSISDASCPTVPRIAVIGGGISGLAAALRITELLPNADLHLFEAAPRLGGVLETASRDGFLIERSADNFLTAPPAAVELCRDVGIADQLLNTDEARRRAMVVRSGQLLPIPRGFYLMSPQKLWPILTSPLLSIRGKLRLLAEPFVSQRKPSPSGSKTRRGGRGQVAAGDSPWRGEGALDDESVASFARRRLGREVFERLVQPLVAGIYTADPEQLSMAATMPQFWACKQEHASLLSLRAGRYSDQSNADASSNTHTNDATGARYSLFAAPKDGMASLIEAIERRFPTNSIHFNTSVQKIQPHPDGGWQVSLEVTNPQSEIQNPQSEFDALILAVPAHAAARLLAQCDPRLDAELVAIPYAGCAVVSIGFARNQIGHALDAFGFVVPHVERRRIIAASFASLKFPGRAPDDCVLVRVFIGGALQPLLAELPDDDVRQIALEELRDLLQITGEPLLVDIARWPGSMPQYHVGHLDRVARIEQLAARHPKLALAGNAYRGVGIPQCIASGQRAAELVAGHFRH
jgi:oxygen-dependent protoporphyrinogen oxidase